MKLKKSLKKFWDFLWHGESVWSYLAFIIFSFITLSILYQLFLFFLGFFGVEDLFVVITGSMLHSGDIESPYYEWMELHGFNRSQLDSWIFSDGLNLGDLMVIMKVNPEELEVGDVIVYNPEGAEYKIIHRVIFINESDGNLSFTTKGDANFGVLSFERELSCNEVVGRAEHRVPFVGIPKMIVTRVWMIIKGGV